MKKKTLENVNELNMSGDTEKITENNEEAAQPTITDSESNGVDMSEEMGETVEPTGTDSENNEVVMYRTFTISKQLTSKEAVQLLSDFERYRENHTDEMYVKTISKSGDDESNDWGRNEYGAGKCSIWGYSYYNNLESTWEIMEYREVCRDFEYKDYFIDIIFDLIIFDNGKSLSYDGNLLKEIIDCKLRESKAISPFFDDFSSYVLKQIDYKVDIITEQPRILAELQRRSNLPAVYREWESFSSVSSEASKTKTLNYMDSRIVKVCRISHNKKGIYYNINRKFRRDYSVKELIEEDSAETKFIIKQMLSTDYLKRSAVTYLKTAIMGGSYYSISRAADIINSSSIPIERKDQLLQTLIFVEYYKGIRNAKMVYKDNKEALYEFINNLHELVELGINPVIIPKEHNIDEVFNPIPNLDGGKKKADSYIEVEEEIGFLNVPCRIQREK